MSEHESHQGEEKVVGCDQFLTFSLGGDKYGLDILSVKEIIEYAELTRIPLMPDFIRGVLNLRGLVVPIIDLLARFGGEPAEITRRSCFVIVEVESDEGAIEIGMLVDEVNDVVEISRDNIEPTPSFGNQIRTDFISGMGKISGHFIVLLQIAKVLSIDELSLLSEVNRSLDQACKAGNSEPAPQPDPEQE
ncbi:chemotaxis protein CheW [Thalassomonas viridans]|uniref:Chemotaxis protein CheW n=1 Tax=Thalassomonas viridans TaxID=137584 RepID=A0AAE9Z523_9GAMM|nr:chemotaxis protein CheW [Thalassomonas viridans]WDE06427.1 chemotaxis protein CheW [Thalassomonas viridans]